VTENRLVPGLWTVGAGVLIAVLRRLAARQAVPAELDPANTACQMCRMAVSDVHLAAQIAVPGVESQFFDDIGCLGEYLRQANTKLPPDAVVFVADHRTGAWVRASGAMFTRAAQLETPMGGGIIAHASEESRRQDADAVGGTGVPMAELFGPSGPPNGRRP
jgi:copper chaperone NosL